MTQQTILVVDDHPEAVRAVVAYLEREGYRVLTAETGNTAIETVRAEKPDLVVLDWMLPDLDGISVLEKIRADDALRSVSVIMLTAKIEDDNRIEGLDVGADDYVTKPYNPREVLARVRTVLRRTANPGKNVEADTIISYDGLTLDEAAHRIEREGDVLSLTRTEFDILKALLSSPGRVFTRAELMEAAFPGTVEGFERTLDTHVKNIRKKLGEDAAAPRYIHTVYGVGYRLGT
ncbi:MAG: response regulator transcription factor [Chloroflexota bacterium]